MADCRKLALCLACHRWLCGLQVLHGGKRAYCQQDGDEASGRRKWSSAPLPGPPTSSGIMLLEDKGDAESINTAIAALSKDGDCSYSTTIICLMCNPGKIARQLEAQGLAARIVCKRSLIQHFCNLCLDWHLNSFSYLDTAVRFGSNKN